MKQKGFSLIELLVVVTIIAIIGLLLVQGGCRGNKDAAVKNARTFATDLGYTVVAVNCAGRDSDGDGYIACTVRVAPGKSAGPDRLQLECESGGLFSWFKTEGCKERVPDFTRD